jgi:NCAIR mutase (PurE)-related protein
MKTYLDETFIKQVKAFRSYETSVESEWGGKKRLFKCVDVHLEIKFCKAQMLFDEALTKEKAAKKIEMIEMMYRAYNALITKAEESGYSKLDNDYKCYQYNKDKIAIICNSDLQLSNLKSIHGKDKDVILFSMEEIFRILTPGYTGMKEVMKKNGIDGTFKEVIHGKGI